ncbi:MAG: hypothetical protein ISS74_04625 [Planctomycetes bacterium]|nr:hypothetical protein [Planctomycetota bacterium]
MEADPNAAVASYPLVSLLPVLRTFEPPAGAFNPAGPWRQTWGVYTFAGRTAVTGRVGRLTLQRQVNGAAARLEVTYSKELTGGREEVTGTLEGPADAPLATPDRWTFRIRLLDAQGNPVPHTDITRKAVRDGGQITISDPSETRRLAVPGPYTVNWCLFDAVQRLPGEDTKPLAFTLIDHADQVKPETTLAFRKAMDVQVAGGKTVRTRAYEQLGRGNVPWVYWTDEAGRLLWVVAGLEGYALEAAGESAAKHAPAPYGSSQNRDKAGG